MKSCNRGSLRRTDVDDEKIAFDQRCSRRAEKILRYFEFGGEIAFPVDLPRLEFEAVQFPFRSVRVHAVSIDYGTGARAVVIPVAILELRGVAEIPIFRSGFRMQAFDLLLITLTMEM